MEKTKKHFFIVLAHPNPKSFNVAIKDFTVKCIESLGHTVDVSDLYRMDFKGHAGADDFKTHLNKNELNLINEQQNSMKLDQMSDDIRTEMEKLSKADYIIFIFPIWWGGTPSILKGWIDRVLACDFAWTNQNLFYTGKFLGKRAAIFTSTGSPEEEYSENGNNKATLEQMLINLHRGTFAFLGCDVLRIHTIFGVDEVSEEKKNQHFEKINDIITNFGTYELLHKMYK
jgi:NAD(P)H dehydrogenase (quinone)